MSSGAKGGPSRVSIPSGVKKMIDNIKEITGQNHSEDEIYAMLKECSMDPNETTQKLLALDTFHEVKRKRDKKKENLNKDPAELKWKPGAQARPNRGGRGNYPSRYVSHDTSGGRNFAAVKENSKSHFIGKNVSKGHLVTSQDVRKNGTSSVASQVSAVSNGPSINQSGTTANFSRLEGPLHPPSRDNPIKNLGVMATKDLQQNQILESSNSATSISIPSSPTPGSCFSSSDPVLLPSPDTPLPSAVGTIRRSVGSQQATPELIDDNPTESKSESVKVSTSKVGTPTLKQKIQNDFHGVGKSQHDLLQAAPSTVSGPLTNYNNRSQAFGPQKVVLGKEWKPKSANANAVQSTATLGNHPESQTTSVNLSSKEATIELQKKLEDSHISDGKHVIIPNHLHVPDIEKLGFRFGSFDASFGLDMNQNSVPGSDKSPAMSESSETIDEPLKEPQSSNLNVSVPSEDDEMKYPEHPQSPIEEPENLSSSEVEVSSSVIPDYDGESKPVVAPESRQHLVVQASSNYNIGFMPPILGGQLTPLESSESQARDASRLPGFVVQQSFDPGSYYAQFYRSGLDSDGRISPFHPAGATNKYNGSAAVVSAQTSQTPQEGGVPLVASPTLMTQAAGVMQSSISPSQQPPPVFRQPAGVHLPHYPPNYIPYGPYFSPYYVPPPAIHQFMGNGAFPQQPQAGSLYPSAPGSTAKYSVSQYKQGLNTGGSTHVGVPGNYGPYGLPVVNYASGSATTTVTSTSDEENANPQIKEDNLYGGGQQNDGSGLWFTTPMRDISTLQASSFYNLPQGQLAFTPAQPGHGAFPGILHPTQAVTAANVHPFLQQSQPAVSHAVDIVGPTGGVYQQQPQHTQISWPSNY